MSEKICHNCGEISESRSKFCQFCGAELKNSPQQPGYTQQTYRQPSYQQPSYEQPYYQQNQNSDFKPAYPGQPRYPKDRITAAILAIIFGTLGVHKFYLGSHIGD